MAILCQGASVNHLGKSSAVVARGFSVSVVVPVRDEEQAIGVLLECLYQQTRWPEEVVIVDGGSTDRTPLVVQHYIAKGYPIRLIRTPHAYPGEGRNRGIREAEHAVIALTDAGVRPCLEWLERLCEPLERDPAIAVVYGTYEPLTRTYFDECAALAYVPARLGPERGNIRGPSIASTLIRKEVWAGVGGFPGYRASEDLIFIERVERRGFKTAYAPGAWCAWELARGWRGTFRRFAVYSYHNLVAGRGRYWHMGLMRQYLIALPFAFLAIAHHYLWWSVPVVGFGARVGRTMWRKRGQFSFENPLHPLRWLTVAVILVLLDTATWVGAAVWVWRRMASGFSRLRMGSFGNPSSKA